MNSGPSEEARRDPTRRPPEWKLLPPPIERFAAVEQLIPEGVMKHQRANRFEWIPFTIISYPQGRDPAVYGVFSIDLCAMKRGRPKYIKQDFLVYERDARPPVATYYSGWNDPMDTRIQHIQRFCARFGAPHYGCRLEGRGQWVCDNHWYAGPEDPALPLEERLRQIVRETVERARLRLDEIDCSTTTSERPQFP